LIDSRDMGLSRDYPESQRTGRDNHTRDVILTASNGKQRSETGIPSASTTELQID